jgi:Icc protein
MKPVVHFAHISDSHLGSTRRFTRWGRAPAEDLERVVEELRSLPVKLDFLIHTGDIVDADGISAEEARAGYQLTQEILGKLGLPLYFIAGNHDNPALVRSCLTHGPLEPLLPDTDAWCYRFASGGMTGIVLDARVDAGPVGRLPADQVGCLEQLLGETPPPVVVFIHFPCLPLGAAWSDPLLLVDNGLEVHRVLARHVDRLRGVFFGHVHRAVQIWREGVLYASSPSSTYQFEMWPDQEHFAYDTQSPVGFNIVTVGSGALRIRPHFYQPTKNQGPARAKP